MAGWDLGRFMQTLAYFEVVPPLTWIQQMFQPVPPPAQPTLQNAVIFDFRVLDRTLNQTLEQTWGAVDDVVMGGVSASQFQLMPDGAWFSGKVSIENSGGFASVRSRNFAQPLDLSAFQGIELRLQGDGQRYKFLLRTDSGWDTIAFSHAFDTLPAQWMTVRVPFAQMIPVFRARTLQNTAPLNARQVRSLQFMLSKFEYDGQLNPKFQPGPFQLKIESIRGY
ncbi:MAG: CIA30 family protein [Synechococcales bacterium]|nr:CIA30 family protein [Synechococcales bacterium]